MQYVYLQLDNIQFNMALEADSFDIDKYLPINTSEEADAFMDNSDGLFDLKKKAVLRRVYGAADITSSTNFVGSVIDVFFTQTYQIANRWPSKQ